MKKWFRSKSYGWGWVPSSKEGWFVILGFLVLLIGTTPLATVNPALYTSAIIIEVLVLVVITARTGKKPEWRWGGKKIEIKKIFKPKRK